MSGTPLNVYTYVPNVHTASFYYRLIMPLRAMHDLGLPIRAMVDTDSISISQEQKISAFCEADVCLLYQPANNVQLHNIRQVQTFIPSMRDGAWKWPPSIVIETDDNLFHVSPLNPAYSFLGTKDPNGKEIPSGNHIGVIQNGEPQVRWIDGHTCDGKCGPGGQGNCGKGINLAANRENLNCYRKVVNAADAIQVSTPALADVMCSETTPRRLKVFPNLVRFDDYEQVDLAPRPKQVRILWQGGQNHYEDWFPLRKQLGRITKRYPEVHWVIWGAIYPWVMEEIPAERYTFINWCPYQEYKLRLAMIGHDINLAPLQQNPFNACRSAIKWYESSVLKRPAVTLAQNSGSYGEMQSGETGLLFEDADDFENKLASLIEQPDQRVRMATNAKQWLSDNRDAMKRVPEIYNFWWSLRDERKIEQPHVTDAEWQEILKLSEAEEQARQQQAVAA